MSTNHFEKKLKTQLIKYSVIAFLSAVMLSLTFIAYEKYDSSRTMIASFSPYNFTDQSIANIYVNDTWAGNVMEHSGGGGGVCCTTIPRKWRPGLFVDIRWQIDNDGSWHNDRVTIPEYKESASLQILFFDNKKIEVYVMDYWPCSDKHPMPKDACKKRQK
jgi:hypothetical protein